VINPKDLKKHVIEPTLKYLDMYSDSAVNLLLGTAAVESDLGYYLRQKGCEGDTGAFGIYQMELATHNDILQNYVAYRDWLAYDIDKFISDDLQVNFDTRFHLISNLAYATAMARVHYYRVPAPLPDPDDKVGLANYWKDHYNSHLGKGTPEKFLEKYETLVLNHL